MNNLSVHLKNYLKLRRGLGFKLHGAGMFLRNFVRFAESKRGRFITTKRALQWATQPLNTNRQVFLEVFFCVLEVVLRFRRDHAKTLPRQNAW